MRWSKLKKRIEDNFAVGVKYRVAIHSAAYGNCSCGHAWMTLDGDVIANFCTRALYNRFLYGHEENDRGLSTDEVRRYKNQLVEYGELGRQDVYAACWEYIHDLSFDEALVSDGLFVQVLAVLDKRLGKRRFKKVMGADLHPLARKLLEVRIS